MSKQVYIINGLQLGSLQHKAGSVGSPDGHGLLKRQQIAGFIKLYRLRYPGSG
jgi:hypothetical protein